MTEESAKPCGRFDCQLCNPELSEAPVISIIRGEADECNCQLCSSTAKFLAWARKVELAQEEELAL